MNKECILGIILTVILGASTFAAGGKSSLPTIASASVPLYPRAVLAARIQGDVVLSVSTDGKHISDVSAESGAPLLIEAAKENLKTWVFEVHSPTKFKVKFRYKLLVPTKCDSECICESKEQESVVLKLPTVVEVTAQAPVICDPPATKGILP